MYIVFVSTFVCLHFAVFCCFVELKFALYAEKKSTKILFLKTLEKKKKSPVLWRQKKNSAIQSNASRPQTKPLEFPELSLHPTDDVSKNRERILVLYLFYAFIHPHYILYFLSKLYLDIFVINVVIYISLIAVFCILFWNIGWAIIWTFIRGYFLMHLYLSVRWNISDQLKS